MKRVINKNVLNGFLNQAVSHNKYLEESEMWKQKREREVSHERHESKKRLSHSNEHKSKSHKSNSPAPKCSANEDKDDDEIDDAKVLLALYRDINKKAEEKWDHSGFLELYPNGVEEAKKTRTETTRRPSADSSDHKSRSLSKKKSKHKKSHSKHRKKSKKKHKKSTSDS